MKVEKQATHGLRIKREKKTLEAMIAICCHGQHGGNGLCSECRQLSAYAARCLARCPFKERKPTCARCPVHCYKPAMREKTREGMRYSGPRMAYRHPVLALLHFIDSRKRDASMRR